MDDTKVGERVDVNKADVEDISDLGLGEVQAEALLAYREEHGPFRTWEDLEDVPGFDAQAVDIVRRNASMGEDDDDSGLLFAGADDEALLWSEPELDGDDTLT